MRTLTLMGMAAAVSILSAPSVMAQQATYRYAPTDLASSLTRADVRDQAMQGRAAGRIGDRERSAVGRSTGVANTRVQVLAELKQAKRLGLLARGQFLPIATAAQRRSIHEAGMKAVADAEAGR